MSDERQRVALVTGAAGGIGAATARTLAAEGAAVVVHDLRREGRLQELAEELGDTACAVAADLSDAAAADALWHEAVGWRGHIDVLVNNAGIYEAARPDDDLAVWQAAWERTLAICLVSPAALCRAAIASFREQPGGGIIVNLASRAAWRGEDADYWHYAAAKAGVVAMTKTIARQYGRQGVTAFAVAPGFVDTPFNAPAVEEHGMELFVNDTALGEVAQPQDVANVIAFLASGKARHATGATVDVNTASYVR
ncbi:MAG TPA: SDR family oxidoreductase [Gaiellales bacterium]|nr:SDR family oxidoreductase [Gaiellales bacterium]